MNLFFYILRTISNYILEQHDYFIRNFRRRLISDLKNDLRTLIVFRIIIEIIVETEKQFLFRDSSTNKIIVRIIGGKGKEKKRE